MNISRPLSPLPEVLDHPRMDVAHRRYRIGDHQIDPDALEHFNELLERLDLARPPLDRDQVASAARELAALSQPARWPECVLQRMRRAAAIDRMLGDHEWEVMPSSAEVAAMVIDYLRGNHPLIPNTVPVVGRLDDVILVEASWPTVAQEVRDYLDFCRVRRIEAALRGEPRPYFGFTREAWRDAARAEADWIAHTHRVSTSRYANPFPEVRFQVH
jgi:hypothetical protein